MKKKVLVFAVCGLFILSGCSKSPKLSDGKQVVASLNGKDITAEELFDNMKQSYGTSSLISLVDEYIISKEITDESEFIEEAEIQIQQYKISYGDQWNDFLQYYNYSSEEDLKKDLLLQLKSEELAKKQIKESITEEDLKKYYDENISTELTVKHILIKPDVDKDASSDEKAKAEEKAYSEAVELIKKLDEGADFETLAKENSDDTGSASNGGLITGVTKSGYDANFYKGALELEDGKYSKTPIKSEYGYHIIYTISRTEAESYDEMKESLYDKVISKKISDDPYLTYKAWDEIRKKYNINIIDTTIKSSYEAAIGNLK
ncbi:MAG: peptidylprolyl isomerase [Clostridium sp.]|nr:peptidylprolyl isomerase [Clostridium sp.]MCM1444317.1 peptidylprolyl isomerase [Candidatus Amulumruptor caecigallinarius]